MARARTSAAIAKKKTRDKKETMATCISLFLCVPPRALFVSLTSASTILETFDLYRLVSLVFKRPRTKYAICFFNVRDPRFSSLFCLFVFPHLPCVRTRPVLRSHSDPRLLFVCVFIHIFFLFASNQAARSLTRMAFECPVAIWVPRIVFPDCALFQTHRLSCYHYFYYYLHFARN